MRRRDAATVLLANPGADLYGSDRMLLETVRAVVASGARAVVTVPEEGQLVPLLEDAGAEVRRCPSPVIRKSALSPLGLLRLAWEAARSVPQSWKLLRDVRPSLVLVNTLTAPLWLPLAKLAGTRTACHVHEAEDSVSRGVRTALYVPLVFADRVVVNSEFARSTMRHTARWLDRRSTVVHNAVAGPRQVTPPRRPLDGPVRLLFVGRLSERKGPQVALEAVSLLKAQGTPVTLRLLGAAFRGNEAFENRLRSAAADFSIVDEVSFLGFRPNIWEVVAEADVLVVPSVIDEPFGNTAVEAGLAARPLVVSDTSGLKEAVTHSSAAVRVPPGDPKAIADAVNDIRDHWERYAAAAEQDAVTLRSAFSSERYDSAILAALEWKTQGQATPR